MNRDAFRCTLGLLVLSGTLLAVDEHPTGTRITPPTVNATAPKGVARGTTIEMTVEGLNLAKASAIYFDKPGITGKIIRVKELPDLPDIRLGANGTPSTIDLGPLPPRNQVTVEVDVSPEADIGAVGFRLQTPLGTSPEGRILVEPYYGESPDKEPNNTLDTAFETFTPTILVGEISKPGDVDYFKIKAKAGEELVFANMAAKAGSSLTPLVAIVREDMSVVREERETEFAHKFDKAGVYYIRVADALQTGRSSHFYRVMVGGFPVVSRAFPLGVREGQKTSVALRGFRVDPGKLDVVGKTQPDLEQAIQIRPAVEDGKSFSELRLALGRDPEVLSAGANQSLDRAQSITFPATVNGIVTKGPQYFRVHAAKGQKIVFEVAARRLGSKLDSLIEVLDAKGKPVETATVRAISETSTALRDHGSGDRGIRINSSTGLAVGDYLMIGNEIVRMSKMPASPDDDAQVEAFDGRRVAFFNTSPEAHALDQAVYKVQIHPPATQFAPNGLPIVHLFAQNDDGGPGFGKDSYLLFTAPAEGDYNVRLSDVRNLGGEEYAFRLNIREPRPDFRLSVNPTNPNVPLGGSIPLTITALRLDGFDGAIDVALDGLPAGLSGTRAQIAPGQYTSIVLLSAEPQAVLSSAAPLRVAGVAASLKHLADPEDRLKFISLMPQADVAVRAVANELTVEAGDEVRVKVLVARQNGFGGRVPLIVRNLPPRVLVPDIGLNGVLVNENENEREVTIRALDNVEPIEQLIYISGAVETRAGMQNEFSSPQPILLHVKPRAQVASR